MSKRTKVSITQSDTATVLAAVTPADAGNKNVTWSSDAEDVATVTPDDNPATITAVKAGSATVTCTTEDGEFTDTVAVTVTESG